MASRRQQPHRLRQGEAIVLTSTKGQAVIAPISISGRVHVLPPSGTVLRRLKREADDRLNDECSGK